MSLHIEINCENFYQYFFTGVFSVLFLAGGIGLITRLDFSAAVRFGLGSVLTGLGAILAVVDCLMIFGVIVIDCKCSPSETVVYKKSVVLTPDQVKQLEPIINNRGNYRQ
jgi:hypothetical protein